jgi:hypothetical protein
MMGQAMGITYQNSNEPDPAGERAARFVDDYLAAHPGLSLGELAFRLKADKRDLQRLVRDRSCGWRLADSLASYFGDLFVDALFRPVIGSGPSKREKELERERAEIAARRERLERDRQADRVAAADARAGRRVAARDPGGARV